MKRKRSSTSSHGSKFALMSQDEAPEQLECQPTTLAKAVTGKEVPLAAVDDHVAIVPFDELLEVMKEDISSNAWRIAPAGPRWSERWPIKRLSVEVLFFEGRRHAESSAGTYMTGSISRFSHCYFLPVAIPVGSRRRVR